MFCLALSFWVFFFATMSISTVATVILQHVLRPLLSAKEEVNLTSVSTELRRTFADVVEQVRCGGTTFQTLLKFDKNNATWSYNTHTMISAFGALAPIDCFLLTNTLSAECLACMNPSSERLDANGKLLPCLADCVSCVVTSPFGMSRSWSQLPVLEALWALFQTVPRNYFQFVIDDPNGLEQLRAGTLFHQQADWVSRPNARGDLETLVNVLNSIRVNFNCGKHNHWIKRNTLAFMHDSQPEWNAFHKDIAELWWKPYTAWRRRKEAEAGHAICSCEVRHFRNGVERFFRVL